MAPSPPHILVVDDNEADFYLLREASREVGFEATYEHIPHAHLVESRLSELAASGQPRPDLMLIDMNMPRIDGKELLRRIRSDPQHASIPLVMSSSSHRESDQVACKELGAIGFAVKPSTYDAYAPLVATLRDLVQFVRSMPPGTDSSQGFHIGIRPTLPEA